MKSGCQCCKTNVFIWRRWRHSVERPNFNPKWRRFNPDVWPASSFWEGTRFNIEANYVLTIHLYSSFFFFPIFLVFYLSHFLLITQPFPFLTPVYPIFLCCTPLIFPLIFLISSHDVRHFFFHFPLTPHLISHLIFLFRCVLASLYESVSVGPSVRNLYLRCRK